MINDGARTIELEGQHWVIGGVWSTTEYERRPGNLYKFSLDNGFDPERTLVAHLGETNQMGWYQFESEEARPRRAACLAERLHDQAVRRDRDEFPLPAVVILNLGECAWMTILDQAGNLVAEHERWGSMDELRAYLQEDDVAELINTYRSNDHIEKDAEKAISWLFDGYRGRPVFAERLYATTYSVKLIAISGIALVVMIGGAWKYHEVQEAKKRAADAQAAWLAKAEYQAQLRANEMLQLKHQEQFEKRLHDYWENYPRPWVNALPESVLSSACESYLTNRPLNINGWERESSTCSFSGPVMTVSETWKRGDMATVLNMPPGAVPAGTGDQATDTTTVNLPVVSQPKATPKKLPDDNSATLIWMADNQISPGQFQVKQSSLTPFKPPVPPFVPQDQVKKVAAETPVLWNQADIDLSTSEAPSDGWLSMNQLGLVVSSITITYQSNGVLWDMTGVQYAQ